ncbi:hypothetical protein [Dactylosporangium sp. NPDC051484]|uniref:hypothetical protein n=1 Tax=Dactylosporangium sp. NPDC051484 TaxID=3154942 RepID=UPI00344EEBD6
MPTIDVHDHTFVKLQPLADAWGLAHGEMIDLLIDNLISWTDTVAVHTHLGGTRVEATFFPAGGELRITSGFWAGTHCGNPSQARDALLSTAPAEQRTPGDGWDFWIVTNTGEPLRSLHDTAPARARRGAGRATDPATGAPGPVACPGLAESRRIDPHHAGVLHHLNVRVYPPEPAAAGSTGYVVLDVHGVSVGVQRRANDLYLHIDTTDTPDRVIAFEINGLGETDHPTR